MHPTSVQHSSAPRNPASWLALLRLPRQVPLEQSDVHESRGGKCLLNSLGYTTYGNKGWLINFLYFVGPSWILNIWDVWVHTFKVHRARHMEPGRIFSRKTWSATDFRFKQTHLCLMIRYRLVGDLISSPSYKWVKWDSERLVHPKSTQLVITGPFLCATAQDYSHCFYE